MGNVRRGAAPASIVVTAILAASVTIPVMPPHVASPHAAALTSPAPQTLQVRLASLVEQAIEQAMATPAFVPAPLNITSPMSAGTPASSTGGTPDNVESVGAAPKPLTHSASTTAARPPVGYSPFYPFTTPTTPVGSFGWWLTLPIAIPGLVFDSLAQSWSRDLAEMGLDIRLANQPELLSRYLLVPIAVTVQTTLTGLIGGGTYELGKFTLPQAVSWAANNLRKAIVNTLAAEKDLLNGGTGVLPDDETVVADKPFEPSAPAPATAATATTKPRVAQRPVPSAYADTDSQENLSELSPTSTDDTGEDAVSQDASDVSLSPSSPTEKAPTGRTNMLRLGPISLPSPFSRSTPAAASPASPSTRQATPERRLSVKSAMTRP